MNRLIAHRVLGHNVLLHDLPVMRGRAPETSLLGLPVVDTLEMLREKWDL